MKNIDSLGYDSLNNIITAQNSKIEQFVYNNVLKFLIRWAIVSCHLREVVFAAVFLSLIHSRNYAKQHSYWLPKPGRRNQSTQRISVYPFTNHSINQQAYQWYDITNPGSYVSQSHNSEVNQKMRKKDNFSIFLPQPPLRLLSSP